MYERAQICPQLPADESRYTPHYIILAKTEVAVKHEILIKMLSFNPQYIHITYRSLSFSQAYLHHTAAQQTTVKDQTNYDPEQASLRS